LASLSSLIYYLWARPGAYPRQNLSGALLYGRLPALTVNIKVGRKGLPRTNPLFYYEHLKLRTKKVLLLWAMDQCDITYFEIAYSYLYSRYKLVRFTVTKLSCLSNCSWQLDFLTTLAYNVRLGY
jgi:hypothetical protein